MTPDLKQCRYCGEIYAADACPACEAEHARAGKGQGRVHPISRQGYGTIGMSGKRVPPKYGWGG